MGKLMDETGKRYHSLTVIRLAETHQYPSGRKRFWECKCDCGNTLITPIGPLKNGRTLSCGCYHKSHPNFTKHRMTNTRLFRVWANMLGRCKNINHPRYRDYGGRGIRVCDEWDGENGSSAFIQWAIQSGYKDNLTLDRIDNDGDYTPQNCRWTTNIEQNRNKRSNRVISFEGETHCISEWSEITGINRTTIAVRLKRGWSVEDALTIPKGEITDYKKFKKENSYGK